MLHAAFRCSWESFVIAALSIQLAGLIWDDVVAASWKIPS